ncbi:DNA-binding protein RFX2 [Folsomia candida]|nr:DNA-binding protein RFX2 [Folsomia candida]
MAESLNSYLDNGDLDKQISAAIERLHALQYFKNVRKSGPNETSFETRRDFYYETSTSQSGGQTGSDFNSVGNPEYLMPMISQDPYGHEQSLESGADFLRHKTPSRLNISQIPSAVKKSKKGRNKSEQESIDASTFYRTKYLAGLEESRKCCKWILDNCEASEGSKIPKGGFYEQYSEHCLASGSVPGIPIWFGKKMFTLFPGLSIQRKDRQPNSTSCYLGVRQKIKSMDLQ